MNLSSVYPNKTNSLFLKKNTKKELEESLFYISELPNLQKNGNSKRLQSLVKSFSHNAAIFPIMLLNHVLTSHYENDNYELLNSDLENFLDSFNPIYIEKVFNYKNNTFSKKYWSFCDYVITNSFSEPVHLYSPNHKFLKKSTEKIQLALAEIRVIDSNFYDEVTSFISNFMIIESERFVAGSSIPLIGLVGFAHHHSVETFVDLIIHECAHQYIYHLTVFDEVCSGDGLYTSPLRPDPRPIEGIYHSMYVLARLVCFYKIAKGYKKSSIYEKSGSLIDSYSIKFRDACDVLDEHGKLTELGRDILESCKKCI